MTPTVVFAAIGANPAPLLQLVWALHRQWGWVARDVCAVVDARGLRYLQAEALSPGAAWDELRTALGASCLARDGVRVVPVHRASGELLPSDDTPDDAARYSDVVWQAARRRVELAGDDPGVFALAAGHRRTQHVAATVRLSERWAHAPGAFFFPEQEFGGPRFARTHAPSHDPASVDVRLVDVQAPRLRGLLRERDLMTHASALRAGQVAIDALVEERLVFDMTQGCVRLGRDVIVLSKAQLLWYATLARERCVGLDNEGWLAVGDVEGLECVAKACSRFGWAHKVRVPPLKRYLGFKTKRTDSENDVDSLTKVRADTLRVLGKFAKGRPRDLASRVVPEKKKAAGVNLQRIALEPERIEFLGVDDW